MASEKKARFLCGSSVYVSRIDRPYFNKVVAACEGRYRSQCSFSVASLQIRPAFLALRDLGFPERLMNRTGAPGQRAGVNLLAW
jgi:hypothetical protein